MLPAVIRAATVRERLVFNLVGGQQTSHPRRPRGADATFRQYNHFTPAIE